MADIDSGGNKNFNFRNMKTNCWLILGMLMATSVLAQDNTNALPPIPAPLVAPPAEPAPPAVTETNAPAAKPKKHHVVPKRAALVEPTVTLVPGTAQVVANNLNVRGRAGLTGEVIGHLNKGDVVTVLSETSLKKHVVGEPEQWAKIALPASTKIWVNANFIHVATKTVLPKKLNLRAGPGENYSVLGTIEHGTVVNENDRKGSWVQIDTPTNAYAFVSAMYLKQEASGNIAENPAPSTETEPTPTPMSTPVAETQPIVTELTNATPAGMETNSPAPMVSDLNTAVSLVNTNPPPPRVVSHEGVVGHVDSVIAPTAYVLYDPATSKEINFLYTTSTNLDIGRYYGMRIVVTGEEALAERWPDTPLLTIQRIEVLATNATPKVYYPSPRQHR
jgi:uncharacterized protein YgiM (DUF1202 family)